MEIQLEGIGQPGHERLLYCKKTTFQFVHQFSILKTIFPNNHSVVCVRLNKKSGLYGEKVQGTPQTARPHFNISDFSHHEVNTKNATQQQSHLIFFQLTSLLLHRCHVSFLIYSITTSTRTTNQNHGRLLLC